MVKHIRSLLVCWYTQKYLMLFLMYTYYKTTGPVPVILRPYLKLDAQLKTIPIEVYAGVRCRYAENFAVGYLYDKKGKSGPIRERKVISKGCKRIENK